MATGHSVGRAGVLVPPSLPTIKETTVSWLGSDFENSYIQGNSQRPLIKPEPVRYAAFDFDEQCLSLKSGEESDVSGIQPLPLGSDDTSPLDRQCFNKVVKMNFHDLLTNDEDGYDEAGANRPRPFCNVDNDSVISDEHYNEARDMQNENVMSDFNKMFKLLDSKIQDENYTTGENDTLMLQKLQVIRQWQIEQQMQLKRQQQCQLALLQEQRGFAQQNNYNNSTPLELNNDENVIEKTEDNTDLNSDNITRKPDIVKLDERPICGNSDYTSNKSFQDLLEKELIKETKNTQQDKPIVRTGESENAKPKHKFLRKGQGISRFNGPPKKPPKRQKADSNKVSNTKSINTKQNIVNGVSDNKRKIVLHKPKLIEKLCLKPSPKPQSQDKMFRPISAPSEQGEEIGNISESSTKEVEKSDDDLEEFELLEKYAEEDASFFSEQSLVVSVLKERQKEGMDGQKSLRERVRERRQAREKKSIKVPTPIYPEAVRNALIELQNNGAGQLMTNTEPEISENAQTQPKIMRRKVVSLIKKEKITMPEKPSAENFIRKMAISTSRSPDVSECSDEEYKIEIPKNEFDDDKTWDAINLSIQSDLNLPEENDQRNAYNCNDYKGSDYIMEPESEEVENPVRDTDSEQNTVVESKRRVSLSPPPPPTMLMQKLFPGLKVPCNPNKKELFQDKTEVNGIDGVQDNKEDDANVIDDSDKASSSLLKQKLDELEAEISKFRSENKRLEDLDMEKQKNLELLGNEMNEFQRQKDEELQRLEEHKKNEIKKLRKDRKVFEDHVMKTKALPSKEERDDIQKLKQELTELKSDIKTKEQRWSSASSRLRSQVQRLEEENSDLKTQIKEIESQRLRDLSKFEAQFHQGKNVAKNNPSVWKTINKMVESTNLSPDNDSDTKDKKSKHQINTKSNNKTKKQKTSHPLKRSPLAHRIDADNVSQENVMSSQNISPLPSKFSPKKLSENIENRPSGKVERLLDNGNKLIEFANGTQKEISPDGKFVKINFENGDVKSTLEDGTVVYYYKENGTTHTTQADGLQIYEFPNKQVEHHFLDGTKQISYPDGTVKYLHTDETEQTVFQDGTEMHVAKSGDKTIVFANGQREIHTASFKRREYPDGTSKTVYEDGRQETRYASGRLRVKDPHGNVIVDRMMVPA